VLDEVAELIAAQVDADEPIPRSLPASIGLARA
jgi:hypothetical protein